MSKVDGIERFIRPSLTALQEHSASKPRNINMENIIKLNANENPYGCSPRVLQAIAAYKNLNLYPAGSQAELKRLIAEYTGVNAENIIAGNGCEELLDIVIRAFIDHDDEVIHCTPSWDMFDIKTSIYGGKLVTVSRNPDFLFDVPSVKAAITDRTKMIVIVNPNNPTGTMNPPEDILEIIDTGLPVVVDEAYVEFSGGSISKLVNKYENLMVFRTFSKWAGIAGIRIGYGIFPAKIAAYLNKIRSPFNVNVFALLAVRESLNDIDYLINNVRTIIEERDRLFTNLSKLKFLRPVPSCTNFILGLVTNGSAENINQKLLDKRILIHTPNIPGWGLSLRFGVGKPEHNDAVINALQEIGEEMDIN